MVDLVGTRTELRRAGANRYDGPVPVPRRAHAVVRRSTRPRSSSTASAAARAATRSSSSRRPRASTSRARWSTSPTATASSSSSRTRTRRRPRGARSASACSSCSSAPRPSTCATCGTRREAARGARRTWPAAGSTRRRCASSASATRRARGTRCCCASRQAGFSDRELLRRRARAAGEGRGAASTTASAGGSCSRSATARGRVLGLRRARAAAPTSSRSTSTPPTAPSSTRAATFRRGHRPRARRRRPGSVIVCRGLHRRHRDAPGRPAQRGRADGHRADRRAGRRARRASRRRSSWRSTPTARARRRCCAPRASRPGARLELRVVPLPAGTDPADLVQPRAREAMRALRRRSRSRSCASTSSASSTRGDLTSAEGKDAVIAGCARSSRSSRRARCARSWSPWFRTARTSRRRSSGRGWRRAGGAVLLCRPTVSHGATQQRRALSLLALDAAGRAERMLPGSVPGVSVRGLLSLRATDRVRCSPRQRDALCGRADPRAAPRRERRGRPTTTRTILGTLLAEIRSAAQISARSPALEAGAVEARSARPWDRETAAAPRRRRSRTHAPNWYCYEPAARTAQRPRAALEEEPEHAKKRRHSLLRPGRRPRRTALKKLDALARSFLLKRDVSRRRRSASSS